MERHLLKGVAIALMLTFVVAQSAWLFGVDFGVFKKLSVNPQTQQAQILSVSAAFSGSQTSDGSSTTDASSTQTNIPTAFPFVPKAATTTHTYLYKLVTGVDPCTLNTLGSQGWQALQFGGQLVQGFSRDEKCGLPYVSNTFDWILFQKDLTLPQ